MRGCITAADNGPLPGQLLCNSRIRVEGRAQEFTVHRLRIYVYLSMQRRLRVDAIRVFGSVEWYAGVYIRATLFLAACATYSVDTASCSSCSSNRGTDGIKRFTILTQKWLAIPLLLLDSKLGH